MCPVPVNGYILSDMRTEPGQIEYNSWGDEIDPEAHQQMKNACSLPISRFGALMPDAHVGYGLPIGSVLATEDAVIPYAVGVDIACRVMLSVFDIPPRELEKNEDRFKSAIEKETRFGIGAKWQYRKQHPVMDEDWEFAPVVKGLKDLAWSQLGTSGSGNHFVEFGIFTLSERLHDLEPGIYVALVSHSGSRGAGNQIATHYSRLALSLHPELPKDLKHLSWLDMKREGEEYWQAMELMGKYASANHHLIHDAIIRQIGAERIMMVENHHNFAWKETHYGEAVIVHRKGATPASRGVLGYIPGSMADPGFLVEGTGSEAALESCSHGAGRKLSRRAAKHSLNRKMLTQYLKEKGVTLISADLDEAPQAYKNIEEVMRAQRTLVKVHASFMPKIVKMAPAGERAED